ncbi:MAG: hypothetical protein AAF623_17860, partial [Planctomycetota bacterium]
EACRSYRSCDQTDVNHGRNRESLQMRQFRMSFYPSSSKLSRYHPSKPSKNLYRRVAELFGVPQIDIDADWERGQVMKK